jgi:hypothetical protein
MDMLGSAVFRFRLSLVIFYQLSVECFSSLLLVMHAAELARAQETKEAIFIKASLHLLLKYGVELKQI